MNIVQRRLNTKLREKSSTISLTNIVNWQHRRCTFIFKDTNTDMKNKSKSFDISKYDHVYELETSLESRKWNESMQRLKLLIDNRISLHGKDDTFFSSIIHCWNFATIDICSTVQIVRYFEQSGIELNLSQFENMLDICVSKFDENGAKSIIKYWFNTMPYHNIPQYIEAKYQQCLSKYDKISHLNVNKKDYNKNIHKQRINLSKQEKIWSNLMTQFCDSSSNFSLIAINKTGNNTNTNTNTNQNQNQNQNSKKNKNKNKGKGKNSKNKNETNKDDSIYQLSLSSYEMPSEFIQTKLNEIEQSLSFDNYNLASKHFKILHNYISKTSNNRNDSTHGYTKKDLISILHDKTAIFQSFSQQQHDQSSDHSRQSQKYQDLRFISKVPKWVHLLLRSEIMNGKMSILNDNDQNNQNNPNSDQLELEPLTLTMLHELDIPICNSNEMRHFISLLHPSKILQQQREEQEMQFNNSQDGFSSRRMDINDIDNNEMRDYYYQFYRRIPYLLKFLQCHCESTTASKNTRNSVLSVSTMHNKPFVESLASLICDTFVKMDEKTNITKGSVNAIINFCRDVYDGDLLFHTVMFDMIKNRMFTTYKNHKRQEMMQGQQVQSNNHQSEDKLEKIEPIRNLTIMKLYSILNGFNYDELKSMDRLSMFHRLSSMTTMTTIEKFYYKMRFMPSQVSNADLKHAIISAAYLRQPGSLLDLLYFMYQTKFNQYDRFVSNSGENNNNNNNNSLATEATERITSGGNMIQLTWKDLRSIYQTILGFSYYRVNLLHEMDFMHLLMYAPPPTQYNRIYLESNIIESKQTVSNYTNLIQNENEAQHDSNDIFTTNRVPTTNANNQATVHIKQLLRQKHDEKTRLHGLIRARTLLDHQTTVLRLLTGIYTKCGSFEDVMKCLYYFDYNPELSIEMTKYGVFYLNECLIHKYFQDCQRLSDEIFSKDESNEINRKLKYFDQVTEMTKYVFDEWKGCINRVLNIAEHENEKYNKYPELLRIFENLSSQIRQRHIEPLGQRLLAIMDEYQVAPTWNICENIWFAFNPNFHINSLMDQWIQYTDASLFTGYSTGINDNNTSNTRNNINNDNNIKYLRKDENDRSSIFPVIMTGRELYQPTTRQGDRIRNSDVLELCSKKLQNEYVDNQHIEYLRANGNYEEAILMMNRFNQNQNDLLVGLSNQLKLDCVKEYVFEKEFKNNLNNHYHFGSNNINNNSSNENKVGNTNSSKKTTFFVGNRLRNLRNRNLILYRMSEINDKNDLNVDHYKDIKIEIPSHIWQQFDHKITNWCHENIFEKMPHIWLEMIINGGKTARLSRKKQEKILESLKISGHAKFDILLIRGINTIEEKLKIWQKFNKLFVEVLTVLNVLSCNYNELNIDSDFLKYNQRFHDWVKKFEIRNQIIVNTIKLSSFAFDDVPVFLIWQDQRDAMLNEFGMPTHHQINPNYNNSNYNNSNNQQVMDGFKQFLQTSSKSFYRTKDINNDRNDINDKSNHNHNNNENSISKLVPLTFIQICKSHGDDILSLMGSTTAHEELIYIRDPQKHKLLGFDIDANDNLITLIGPTKKDRQRIYELICYKYPPCNNESFIILPTKPRRNNNNNATSAATRTEWRDIDTMIDELVSTIDEPLLFYEANSFRIARLVANVETNNVYLNNGQEPLSLLEYFFVDENGNKQLLFGENWQHYAMIMNCLSLSKMNEIGTKQVGDLICQIFYDNMMYNTSNINNDFVCNLLLQCILSLCNHCLNNNGMLLTKHFDIIRAGLLHYCMQNSVSSVLQSGINTNENNDNNNVDDAKDRVWNLIDLLQQMTSKEDYLFMIIEYLYQACKIGNNPNLANHLMRLMDDFVALLVSETEDIQTYFQSINTTNTQKEIDKQISNQIENLAKHTKYYQDFCADSFNLLLDDVPKSQQYCAKAFVNQVKKIWENEESSIISQLQTRLNDNNVLFDRMDEESLSLAFEELSPLLSGDISNNNNNENIEENIVQLFGMLFEKFSECGNLNCLEFLLNRFDFMANSMNFNEKIFNFNIIGDSILSNMIDNLWNYYEKIVGYDDEVIGYYLIELMETILKPRHNNKWINVISSKTITNITVKLAERKLMKNVHSLKEILDNIKDIRMLIVKEIDCEKEYNESDKFDNLLKLLDDVDYRMYLDVSNMYDKFQQKSAL